MITVGLLRDDPHSIHDVITSPARRIRRHVPRHVPSEAMHEADAELHSVRVRAVLGQREHHLGHRIAARDARHGFVCEWNRIWSSCQRRPRLGREPFSQRAYHRGVSVRCSCSYTGLHVLRIV